VGAANPGEDAIIRATGLSDVESKHTNRSAPLRIVEARFGEKLRCFGSGHGADPGSQKSRQMPDISEAAGFCAVAAAEATEASPKLASTNP